MITNFVLTAIRNLLRHRIFSVLNVAGLALGMSCALFIFLMVRFELSYDTYHANVDRIYRINSGGPNDPAEDMDTGSPHALPVFLRQEFPEIEQVGIAFKLNPENSNVKAGEELTRIDELYFVDPGFLKIFHFEWKQGNPSTILHNANEAAVSKTAAERLFNGDAIGKTIRINNSRDFLIAGVFKDPPVNSDFPFEVMLSHKTLEQNKNGYFPDKLDAGWNSYYQTYVLLNDQTDPDVLRPKLKKMIENHAGKEVAEKRLGFAPFPLSEIHFGNGNFNNRTISHRSINILIIIGLAILVIASINFTNLATAQAVRRAKEVGIRKSLGSSRKILVLQFLGETLMVTLAALMLSIIVVSWLATFSQAVIGIPLNGTGFTDPATLLFMGALVSTVTLIAGFYPAVIISGFRTVAALKNASLSMGARGLTLRKGLIGFQFIVSQALIVGTFIVVLQVRHFETTPLGFNKEAILTTDLPYADRSKLATLRNALLQYPEIQNVSFSLNTPATTINKWWDSFEHANYPSEKKSTELKIIDSVYIDMFEIKKLAGQLHFSNDTAAEIIVNETFVKECGIKSPEEAIGQQVMLWGNQITIVGVVQDFQTVNLHRGVHPVTLTYADEHLQKASLKIDMRHRAEAIAHLEKHWKEAFPDYYFTYAFLDDALSTFYDEDRKVSRLLGIFSVIAISIGCMGLLGLTMFVAVQRTKEVGIRRILGATLANIMALLSKDFLLLVLIASACAWPISYYLMDKWLQDFAHAIVLNDHIWVFGVAGVLSILFALITVGSQSLKIALINPVRSLRTE